MATAARREDGRGGRQGRGLADAPYPVRGVRVAQFGRRSPSTSCAGCTARTSAALAARYLAARRTRESAPRHVTVGARPYSLVPVPAPSP
ncbi:hypothetical protein ABZY57_24070 [Streptomyces sp. NPDC006450]|uniref:hypothetical protein n=1 Tax=Streptomyces sp. NPDC006450 TaxID=3155458 RepID=UPI0033B83320